MFENRGVKTTRTQERAPANIAPQTVLDVVQLDQRVVRYVDSNGMIKVTVIVKLGDTYYEPANAEIWAEGCRPLNEWMAKTLSARDESKGVVPKSDSVDII